MNRKNMKFVALFSCIFVFLCLRSMFRDTTLKIRAEGFETNVEQKESPEDKKFTLVIEAEVYRTIRDNAQSEYPGNYREQIFIIDKQIEAYYKFKEYNRDGVLNKELFKDLSIEYEYDFVTMLYAYNKQSKRNGN